MQYLVQMRIVPHSRPATEQEGVAFIEHHILPTIDLCTRLLAEKKILAGGPISGTIGLAFIVDVETARELDALITSLPLWPRMETDVIPLSTFDARADAVRKKLEGLKQQVNTAS